MAIANLISKLTLVGLVGVLATLTSSTPTWADTDTIIPAATTGMVGIIRGETARLSVLNAEDLVTIHPEPKLVELKILDAAGNVLARSSQMVAPGQAVFLDLDPSVTTPGLSAGAARLQIRGVVTPGSSPCVSTLEIFDNTSMRTTVLLHGNTVHEMSNQSDE